MSRTQAYLYRWTHKSSGMWYVGCRTAKGCHPDDGYLCSSNLVKPLLLESPTDWDRKILCIADPNYILNLETLYLHEVDAKNDPLSFNQHNGDGKFILRSHSQLTKNKFKDGRMAKENNGFYGKKHTTESIEKSKKVGSDNGMFGKYNKDNPNFGKIRSDESKIKYSLSKVGNKHPSKNTKNHKVCEHCGLTITLPTNYTRWHGEKCKRNTNV